MNERIVPPTLLSIAKKIFKLGVILMGTMCVWSCITPAKQAAPIPDPLSDIHSRQLFLTLNLYDIVHLRDIIHELKSPTYWVHHSVKNMCKLVSNIIYESS